MTTGAGLPVMLGRALRRRCPRCGGGPVFRRWMTMAERCPRCGVRFEREEGYWVGAMVVDTAVAFGLFLALVAGALLVTWPEVPWTGLLVGTVVVNGLVTVGFYPQARLIWMALDLRVRPLRPDEDADAADHASESA